MTSSTYPDRISRMIHALVEVTPATEIPSLVTAYLRTDLERDHLSYTIGAALRTLTAGEGADLTLVPCVETYCEAELLSRTFHADDECDRISSPDGHLFRLTLAEVSDRMSDPRSYPYSAMCACMSERDRWTLVDALGE